VGYGYCPGSYLSGQAGKEVITGFAAGLFERPALLPGQGGDVYALHVAGNVPGCGRFGDKAGIGAGFGAQTVM
jgi:hypothetical protein